MASPRFRDTRALLTQLDAMEKYFVTPAAGQRGDVSIATTALAVGANAVVTNVAPADYPKFAAGRDILIVGAGGEAELNRVATTPTSASLPLVWPSNIVAAVGSRVVTMAKVDLGEIGEAGVTFTGTATSTDITSSTSRLALASILKDGKLGFSCDLKNFHIENLQTVMGVPEGAQGDGSAATPYSAAIIGRLLGTEGLCAYRARGYMKDGLTQYYIDFVNASVVPNVNATFGGDGAAVMGLAGSCTSLIARIWT